MVGKIKSKRAFPLLPLHLSAGRTLQGYRVPTQAKAIAKVLIIYQMAKTNNKKKYEQTKINKNWRKRTDADSKREDIGKGQG